MKRSDGAQGPELAFSPLERRLFALTYRGKLRVARLYSRLARLHREPFAGIADVPSGRFLVDSRHPEDWAMLFGGMEESQLRWATSQVTRGSIAWDVGAHHGYYAIALARVVGSEGSVQAFEPFPESAEVVRRNAQLNRVAQTVAVHACAIGERSRPAVSNSPKTVRRTIASYLRCPSRAGRWKCPLRQSTRRWLPSDLLTS